jgi:hypothetical protein
MLTVLLLSLACAPSTSCALPASSETVPLFVLQDEDEIQDKRPEIKELLGSLKGHIGKRGNEDTEAIGVIDKLLTEYPRCGPKDRGSITKGLGKCLDQKRKDLDEGVPNSRLFTAAAVALGEMGKEATPVISKYIGHKRLKHDLALQRTLILSLGKTKDVTSIKALLKLLNNKDNVIIAATAEALGEFKGAPQKLRKDIFNELLKLLVTTKALKDGDINDIASREKYDVIAAPVTTTLQLLSGHDERKPEQWQRWWNKNKKGDWGEED